MAFHLPDPATIPEWRAILDEVASIMRHIGGYDDLLQQEDSIGCPVRGCTSTLGIETIGTRDFELACLHGHVQHDIEAAILAEIDVEMARCDEQIEADAEASPEEAA